LYEDRYVSIFLDEVDAHYLVSGNQRGGSKREHYESPANQTDEPLLDAVRDGNPRNEMRQKHYTLHRSPGKIEMETMEMRGHT
jgi:hypothetical protein